MVTMKNIAKEVGVSQTTVSFVLNGKYKKLNISEKTRQKIEDTAKMMGYYRNSIATSMVTGKSNVIAYFSGNLLQEHIGRLIYGINMTANNYGFFTKLFSYDISTFEDDVRKMLEQRPAGIICRLHTMPELSEYVKIEASKLSIPLVFLGRPAKEEKNGIYVYTDDSAGVKTAVEYLYKKGHRRIGFLGFSSEQCLRYQGYKKGLKNCGLSFPAEFVFPMKKDDPFFNMNAAERPTALTGSTDAWVLEFFKKAYRVGIKVPEDVSLIGFGDVSFALNCVVPLTTVRQPFVKFGQELTEILADEIKNPRKQYSEEIIEKVIEVELIERDSVASLNI